VPVHAGFYLGRGRIPYAVWARRGGGMYRGYPASDSAITRTMGSAAKAHMVLRVYERGADAEFEATLVREVPDADA